MKAKIKKVFWVDRRTNPDNTEIESGHYLKEEHDQKIDEKVYHVSQAGKFRAIPISQVQRLEYDDE